MLASFCQPTIELRCAWRLRFTQRKETSVFVPPLQHLGIEISMLKKLYSDKHVLNTLLAYKNSLCRRCWVIFLLHSFWLRPCGETILRIKEFMQYWWSLQIFIVIPASSPSQTHSFTFFLWVSLGISSFVLIRLIDLWYFFQNKVIAQNDGTWEMTERKTNGTEIWEG